MTTGNVQAQAGASTSTEKPTRTEQESPSSVNKTVSKLWEGLLNKTLADDEVKGCLQTALARGLANAESLAQSLVGQNPSEDLQKDIRWNLQQLELSLHSLCSSEDYKNYSAEELSRDLRKLNVVKVKVAFTKQLMDQMNQQVATTPPSQQLTTK